MEHVEAGRRETVRRVCMVIAIVAALWAYVVALTDGFALEAGPLRLSSRSPGRAFVLMILAIAAMWALDRKRQRWAEDVRWLSASVARVVPEVIRRHATPRTLAGVAAAATVFVGMALGAPVMGGSDSYGYVSQAHSWATGQLKVPQPLLDGLPAGIPEEALVPLAYRLSPDRKTLVPVYAPGLPMVMSVFERVGGMDAVYLVVPMLAGLAVWMTYAIGRSLVGELGGSIAAVFLAMSPPFVFQLVNPPMSDIAAAAWWAAALFLVWRPSRLSAFGAGLATAAAILTRPNLAPLAIFPGVALLIGVLPRDERPLAAQRLLWFAVPSVAGCLVIAYLNVYWYGSPLASGYGPLAGELFQWGYFWPDVVNNTRSIAETQGPLSLLCVVGVFALWRSNRSQSERTMARFCIGFAVAVYACYAFYLPIPVWWSLRFLFPAFPMFFILLVAGGFAVADRLPNGWRSVGVAVMVAAVTIHAMEFGRARTAFNADGELRYEIVGRYISEKMPADTVFLTMLHSGSVRHYSGRLTVRYDWLMPEQFEPMVTHLKQRGYTPYLLLDDSEAEDFKRHFSGAPVLKKLEYPEVTLPRVRMYPL